MQAPGSDGVTGELKTLQRKFDELTRRGNQGPVCMVNLDTSFQMASGADYQPVTQWAPTANVDTHSMYHYNEPEGTWNGTWWQIPFEGRYCIRVRTIWAAAGGIDGNFGVSTSLIWNGSKTGTAPTGWPQPIPPSESAIGEITAVRSFGIPTITELISDEYILSMGDKLRVNFWSRQGNPTVQPASNLPMVRTVVSITYLGPR